MTREQIEAWLAIEGWQLTQAVTSDGYRWAPFYIRGDEYVLSHKGEWWRVVYDPGNFEDPFTDPPDVMLDRDLLCVYRRLIHEP